GTAAGHAAVRGSLAEPRSLRLGKIETWQDAGWRWGRAAHPPLPRPTRRNVDARLADDARRMPPAGGSGYEKAMACPIEASHRRFSRRQTAQSSSSSSDAHGGEGISCTMITTGCAPALIVPSSARSFTICSTLLYRLPFPLRSRLTATEDC